MTSDAASGCAVAWARRCDFAAAIALVVVAFVATGGSLKGTIFGLPFRLSGFGDPLIAWLVAALLGEWLGFRAGRDRAADESTRPGRWFDPLQVNLVVAAALAAAIPLAALAFPGKLPAPLGKGWGSGPAVLVAVLAAELHRRRGWPGLGLSPAGEPRGRRFRSLLLLVGLPVYCLAISNERILSSNDNVATQLVGPAILKHRSVDLTESLAGTPNVPYYVVRVGDRLLPAFPIGTAILTLPHTAAALVVTGGNLGEDELWWVEKHAAALLAAATAMIFFGAVISWAGFTAGAVATFVFVLATPWFTTGAQALWSVSGELFCIVVALRLLLSDRARTVAPSVALAAAFLCRPTALLVAAGLALMVWLGDRRRGFRLALATAIGVAAVAAAQWAIWGHPLGGYGLVNAADGTWGRNPLGGLAGVLASPSRGLLVFCPYLLLVPVAARLARRPDGERRIWYASLGVSAAFILLAAAYGKWWGGYSIGPRLLTEASPFFALLMVPLVVGWAELQRTWKVAFVLLVGFAAATEWRAAYGSAAKNWNSSFDPDRHREALWSVRDSQLAAIWGARRLSPGTTDGYVVAPDVARGARIVWIDLTPAANSRYDLDPFDVAARPDVFAHYPRIDPVRLNREGALFHFAPLGAANAVTTCRGATPRPIPVPSVRAERLQLLLAAGATDGAAATPTVARIRIAREDGTSEERPIRLNVEAFEYALDRRPVAIPVERLYGGTPSDRDALVRTSFDLAPSSGPIVALTLAGRGGDSPAGVTILAATLERASEPAE